MSLDTPKQNLETVSVEIAKNTREIAEYLKNKLSLDMKNGHQLQQKCQQFV
jgi:hypothetical protein